MTLLCALPSSFFNEVQIYASRPAHGARDMAATREELQTLLSGLEADMPWLMKAYPHRGDFIDAFAGQADLITDTASATDDEWVAREISRILTELGYVDDLAD
jgi:hypothetical protein